LTEIAESSLFSTLRTPFPLQGSSVVFFEQPDKIKTVVRKRIESAMTDFFMGMRLAFAKIQGLMEKQNNLISFIF